MNEAGGQKDQRDDLELSPRRPLWTQQGRTAAGASRPDAATTVAVLAATLGLAAAAWVVAVRQMDGMDMGVATELGSFAFFVAPGSR